MGFNHDSTRSYSVHPTETNHIRILTINHWYYHHPCPLAPLPGIMHIFCVQRGLPESTLPHT
jgi:hypothetical protein